MSDKGEKYDDSGFFGNFSPSPTQYPNPKGMKTFPGFGADEADLELGFIRPRISGRAEYDQANYYNRWTQPKLPDEDLGNRQVMERDFEFRTKELNSKGMLIRPRTPTERG